MHPRLLPKNLAECLTRTQKCLILLPFVSYEAVRLLGQGGNGGVIDFGKNLKTLFESHHRHHTKPNVSAMSITNAFAKKFQRYCLSGLMAAASACSLPAQPADQVTVLKINADQVTAKVSPLLYGLMTEEINYSYEGGLYGELIRNRTFKANPTNALFWSVLGSAAISLDTNQPLNAALNVSLKLDAGKAAKNSPAGIANAGFWGIPVRPNTTYRASFYAKGKGFSGPLTVSLVHSLGTNSGTIMAAAVAGTEAKKSAAYEWHLGKATLTLASAEKIGRAHV